MRLARLIVEHLVKEDGIEATDETVSSILNSDRFKECHDYIDLISERVQILKNDVLADIEKPTLSVESEAVPEATLTEAKTEEAVVEAQPAEVETAETEELETIADATLTEPEATEEPTTETTPVAPQPAPAPTKAPEPKIMPLPNAIILPNAKMNEHYSCVVDWSKCKATGLKELRIEGLEETGLSYDDSTGILSGTPVQHGEFIFTAIFKQEGKPSSQEFSAQLNLFINPDPRLLWTENEPDPNAPYPKPHTATYHNFDGPKKIVAASKRGRSHAKDGSFREDDFNASYNPTSGWYLLTVADGAGSAKYSREGSRLACQTVRELLDTGASYADLDKLEKTVANYITNQEPTDKKTIEDTLYALLATAAFKGAKALEAETQKQEGSQLKDFATTLLVTIAKQIKGKWFVGAFWIGDGGIGIYVPGQAPLILGKSDSGEFAGQTRFLTMMDLFSDAKEVAARVRFEIVDNFTALMLMSDGITDAWFHTDANLYKEELWKDVWANINSKVDLNAEGTTAETQMLSWLDFWMKGEYDDRTIAILY